MTKSNSVTTGKPLGASLYNPLSEIINLIPWNPTVVTAELLDNIALKLALAKPKPTQHINHYILSCLNYLHEIGYVEVAAMKMDSVDGKFYIIKRI